MPPLKFTLQAAPGAAEAGPPAVRELKRRLQELHPVLSDPEADDWDRVSVLRHWAWSHIATSDLPLTLPARGDGWLPMNAPQVFAFFDTGCGGVWCGGAAMALRALYHDFGFTTALLRIHLPAELGPTHVATAVRIQHQGRPLWVVQDAYFNLAIAAPDGQPIDLEDFVRLLSQGRLDAVTLLPSPWPVTHRPVTLVSEQMHRGLPPDQVAQQWWCVSPEDYQFTHLPDGRYRFSSPRTFARYAPMLQGLRHFLPEQGRPPSELFMYLFLDPALARLDTCRQWFTQNR
jgi:hypothetical protein